MSAVQVVPGPLAAGFQSALARLAGATTIDAIWKRQTTPWTDDAGVAATIANRLGWLGALDFIDPQRPRLHALAADVRAAGFTDIVLLGMGGSSLAPEVLRRVLGVSAGYPRFRMLDSVDPSAVRDAMSDAGGSLFIVASKSGSTIEPTVMALEARRRVLAAGHTDWGTRVIAITDDGSDLHRQAVRERFRDVFVNPSDIGGRYSALSYFGLVPAALMGADIDALVREAHGLASACRTPDAADNPGLALGAFIGAAWESGRDKLLLAFPEALQPLGLWIEQLVAESTGKEGKGVVPVSDAGLRGAAGADCAVVTMRTPGEPGASWRADVPVADWSFDHPSRIGAEFFRWEMATAVAAALMRVNPFDEPNVKQAKDATRVLLQRFQEQRQLPAPPIHASAQGARVTLSAAADARIAGASPLSLLALFDPGDYFGLLAFVPPDDAPCAAVLEEFRREVGRRTGCVTTLGFGPRYLHSTGQLHKGGRNNGVFLVVAAPDPDDLAIPETPFSFGVLEAAQALGDFESLDRTGRRALLVQPATRRPEALAAALAALLEPAPR